MKPKSQTLSKSKDAFRRPLHRLVIPLVCCSKCKGSGKTPLGDGHWAVLNTARWLEETDAEEMAKMIQWKGYITAINNRLKDLFVLGFLTRTKEGKR